MSHLARQFCVGLAVTLMVALQGFGAISAEHKIEHAVQFPGVAYVEIAADDHDHDHDRQAVDAVPGDTAFDVADSDIDEQPVKPHHHHGGGDQHLVIGDELPSIDGSMIHVARLGPAPDSVPPGALVDAPHQPPRQNA
ncbi:MAG: hypothetical protein WC563_11340 [Brevundimonas sp.]|uniref:hypothetical protein n=1 Tax=Brevundimonas TaxID=41275 RepID=UPI0022AC327B|nr:MULTISPECIES: hypothetical protein [Brevundimonas]